jgi:glycosyltransferase involved in cell wall biosynthesis
MYGGGAALYARDTAEALSALGHDVRVLTADSRPDATYSVRTDYQGDIQIDRVNLPYLVDYDPDGWTVGLRRWLRHEKRISSLIDQRIAEWRPDIVQYHTNRLFGEAALLTIARNRIPAVALLHDAWPICGRVMLLRSPTRQPCSGPGPVKCLECMYSEYDGSHQRAVAKLPWRVARLGTYRAYRLLRRRAARKTLAGAVGYSRFMADVHDQRVGGRATYLPLGINLAGLPPTMPERPRAPLRFGFLGGFQLSKGIWQVLEAAAALKRDGLQFELHIWGPPGARDQDEISSRGLADRVRLRGLYTPEEIWDAYGELDVAVMATTVCEPFGRIPLEAAAMGAPTIAPAIGGLVESIRDGVDGLLYRFGDADDLERQMRRILTEPGLFGRLCEGLQPVIDTRERGAALEAAYRSFLATDANAALSGVGFSSHVE